MNKNKLEIKASFISRCIVGKINKSELDDERRRETNALDYMQNTSIVYHTESILEAQIITLLCCYVLNQRWSESYMEYGKLSNKVNE